MGKHTVNFKFDIGDKVKVELIDNVGIITNCMVDESKDRYYYVESSSTSRWVAEKFLVNVNG